MRKIETEAEARRSLQQAKTSELTLAPWGRAHGIEPRSLYGWGATLKRREAAREPSKELSQPRFVEVIAQKSRIPRPGMGSQPAGASPSFVVCMGDVRIELGDSFRSESLVRLVAALRQC